MAAGDVTITRGKGFTRDYIDTSDTIANAASVSGVTTSSDGDILTWSGTFTNPGSGDGAVVYVAVPSISSTTYNAVIARAQIVQITTPLTLTGYLHFTDTTVQINHPNFGGTATTSLTVATETILSGKTVDRLGFIVNSNTNTAGTYTFTIKLDFIFLFKETLTLPAASQPLQLPLQRRIADLQIPSREGSILQDLGSPSPQVEIGGTLITTTSPNNYTGDQWWDVLVGVWLEANWQWFTSDRVTYKYQITELSNTQNPGRVGYYDFRMRLKKVDVATATAQTFGSNTGTGAIQ